MMSLFEFSYDDSLLNGEGRNDESSNGGSNSNTDGAIRFNVTKLKGLRW